MSPESDNYPTTVIGFNPNFNPPIIPKPALPHLLALAKTAERLAAELTDWTKRADQHLKSVAPTDEAEVIRLQGQALAGVDIITLGGEAYNAWLMYEQKLSEADSAEAEAQQALASAVERLATTAPASAEIVHELQQLRAQTMTLRVTTLGLTKALNESTEFRAVHKTAVKRLIDAGIEAINTRHTQQVTASVAQLEGRIQAIKSAPVPDQQLRHLKERLTQL